MVYIFWFEHLFFFLYIWESVCLTGSGAVAEWSYAHIAIEWNVPYICVNDGIRDKGEEGISIFK